MFNEEVCWGFGGRNRREKMKTLATTALSLTARAHSAPSFSPVLAFFGSQKRGKRILILVLLASS
jgi:hypothetical protein